MRVVLRSLLFFVILGAGLSCGSESGGSATDAALEDVAFEDGTGDAVTTPPSDSVAGCVDNSTQCGPGNALEICEDGQWIFLQICTPPLICSGGICLSGGNCSPGENLGCADQTTVKLCNEAGDGVVTDPCPEGLFCLDGLCGTQICAPFSVECLDGETLHYCNAEGTAYGDETPCGEGSICINGSCISGCEADYKFGSYIGCEYWTVDLDQYEDPFSNPEPQPHAVVISNPGSIDAHVVFESFSSTAVNLPESVVPAGSSVAFEMPRHDLDGSGIFNRSIRIRSNSPVLAAQFNPLNNEGVASNDGTLLLPRATLGKDHYVMSWPSGPDISALIDFFTPQKGYLAVVAVIQGTTTVTLTFAADVEATLDAAANDVVISTLEYLKGQTISFELEQGQVLQLMAKPAGIFAPQNDLTGTHIVSGRPVMVFGGHEEAGIVNHDDWTDENDCCAEHLEEQMLPVKALSGTVVCGKSAPRGNDPDLWRILATQTLILDTDPVQTTVDGQVVSGLQVLTGHWIEISTEDSFVATATAPLLVGQYLLSQTATDMVTGDPALIHGIPVEQWRDNYPVLVPDGYSQDWFTVLTVAGTQVELDGQLVDSALFQPIGGTVYAFAHLSVDPGTHTLTGDQPFGLILVGYDNAVSYGMVPGLNIKNLAQ